MFWQWWRRVQVLRAQVEDRGLSMKKLKAEIKAKGICLADGKVGATRKILTCDYVFHVYNIIRFSIIHVVPMPFHQSASTHDRSIYSVCTAGGYGKNAGQAWNACMQMPV